MTAAASCTSTSRLTRRPPGRRSRSSKRSRGDSAPRYLLRDRDAIYGAEFRKRVGSMGIEEALSAPRSPWQSPYVERVIGSIRRECLDNVVVLSQRHLRRILTAYFEHYHRWRCHQGLNMDCPERGRCSRPNTAT